jgi:ethanolamine utilization protein EutN
MYLGVVIGTVVATRIVDGLKGIKLLVVQPLDHEYKPAGDPEVAIDVVRACPGDKVFLVGSREASMALDEWFVPVDSAIVGIVDHLSTADK